MAAITLIDLRTDKEHAGIAMSDAHILGHVSANADEVWWRNGYDIIFSGFCCLALITNLNQDVYVAMVQVLLSYL